MRTASLSPQPSDNRKLVTVSGPAKVTTINVKREFAACRAGAKPGVLGVLPVKVASASDSVPIAAAAA